MKICEYDHVMCPYCGEKKKLRVKGQTTELNQHSIWCITCGGLFFIPCED